MPLPAPSASPAAAGPCAVPQLAAIAVRPGIGRAPATSGAICVAPPGVAVVGVGYRDQTTTGPVRQHLTVDPEPVALIGIAARAEVIVAPGLAYSSRTGTSGSGLLPSFGQQDAGAGAQFLLGDRAAIQEAVAVFVTVPSGYPAGVSGFSDGAPTYSLAYTIALPVGEKVGLSVSQGMLVASGASPAGPTRRFIAYQPTVNLSYAVAAATTLLLEDQITAPTGPQSPTGNRALFAVQQQLSPNVLLDAEYELNLLPAPGFSQHALGAGITVRP